MRSLTTRRTAVATILSLTIAACGGGSGSTLATDDAPDQAHQQLEEALAAVDADESVRIRTVTTAETPDGEVMVRAEGVRAGTEAQLMVSADGMDGIEGAGESVEAEVIVLDEALYQRSDGLLQRFGAGAQWVKLDLDAVADGRLSSILESHGSGDVREMLEALVDASDARVVGEEVLDGVPTTHLAVELRYSDVLDVAGADPDDGELGRMDPAELIEVDVWVDGEDRLRRLQSELEIDGAETSTTLDVLEYGVEVDITAPPADQVLDLGGLLSGVGPSGPGDDGDG